MLAKIKYGPLQKMKSQAGTTPSRTSQIQMNFRIPERLRENLKAKRAAKKAQKKYDLELTQWQEENEILTKPQQ